MTSSLARGLVAGAAGTTALNAVTYLDMAVRGRSASSAPRRTVDALLKLAHATVPGTGTAGDSRREGLGALTGIATGCVVGVGASVAPAAGVRLSGPLGAVAIGAAAMAATDLTMAALGAADPRTWSRQDWLADVVPHLVYGVVVHRAVRRTATSAEVAADFEARTRQRALGRLLLRSVALGVASGGRSTLGLAAPVLSAPAAAEGPTVAARVVRWASAAMVAGELVADKLPSTPSRLEPLALAVRLVSGAGGAAALARREHAGFVLAALAGAAGAAAGSYAGAGWRAWAQGRLPATVAALLEDVVAVTLGGTAAHGTLS